MILKPTIKYTFSLFVNLGRTFADLRRDNTTEPVEVARESLDMFNLIGCPLLLSCMCIERYLAVVRPVLYLKLRKLEYRVGVSAVVWVITLSFCVATGKLLSLQSKSWKSTFSSVLMSCCHVIG